MQSKEDATMLTSQIITSDGWHDDDWIEESASIFLHNQPEHSTLVIKGWCPPHWPGKENALLVDLISRHEIFPLTQNSLFEFTIELSPPLPKIVFVGLRVRLCKCLQTGDKRNLGVILKDLYITEKREV